MLDLRDRMKNFLCDELFDWAFGDDEDDLNEALLHVQAGDEFESKVMLVQQQEFHPRLWLHLELRLQQTPPAANQTHFLLAPCPYKLHPYSHCQKHHRGSTEITMAIQKLERHYNQSNCSITNR